jgi:hypothetical protein
MDPHAETSKRPRLADSPEERFGRLFPELPSHNATGDALLKYGAARGPLECRSESHLSTEADNLRIPAGWPFFGQFIAHDITHDRSPLQDTGEVNSPENFRKPRLDLESLYGAGPIGQPYLYDVRDPDKFLIGDSNGVDDLPRNEQGLALIADARDDTHLFISQLHLAFLRFHNRVVDAIREDRQDHADVFDRAVRMVRWHYQWIVLHEYLPLCVGNDLMSELFESGPKICRFKTRPCVPVEFSDGAYRFGHAQIRATYDVNSRMRDVPIFPDLVGMRPVTPERQVDWNLLFDIDTSIAPQPSRKIGPQLVSPMMQLPEALVGKTPRPEFGSLASRDLCRGRSVALASGEAVARLLGLEPCAKFKPTPGVTCSDTPLWLYVLAESEAQRNGEYLGDIGGRIVAEVIWGLLHHDPGSFLNNPVWKPELAGPSGRFSIADLLKYAEPCGNSTIERPVGLH